MIRESYFPHYIGELKLFNKLCLSDNVAGMKQSTETTHTYLITEVVHYNLHKKNCNNFQFDKGEKYPNRLGIYY